MTSTAGPSSRGPEGETPAPAAAFFDLDRTLIAGSSAFAFARASYQAGLLSRRQLARDAWANLKFRLQGSTDEATEALLERVFSSIEGVPVIHFERLAHRVLAELLPRVNPEMVGIAYEHQDAGRPVYIVTAASNEMAQMLANVLTFDGGIGFRSEIADGRYTGRPDGPFTYREGKAQAIRELAAREGYDLAASYAYSDSESDLPMLRAVGHPVAVNPDAPLARVAAEEGWDVIRFERLGRRLKTAAAVATIAALSSASARPRRRARRRWPAAARRRRAAGRRSLGRG